MVLERRAKPFTFHIVPVTHTNKSMNETIGGDGNIRLYKVVRWHDFEWLTPNTIRRCDYTLVLLLGVIPIYWKAEFEYYD